MDFRATAKNILTIFGALYVGYSDQKNIPVDSILRIAFIGAPATIDAYAEGMEQYKALKDARNNSDNLFELLESTKDVLGEKIPESMKKDLEEKLKESPEKNALKTAFCAGGTTFVKTSACYIAGRFLAEMF